MKKLTRPAKLALDHQTLRRLTVLDLDRLRDVVGGYTRVNPDGKAGCPYN